MAQKGQVEEATNHYRLSLELEPGSAETRLQLARLLSGQGRSEEAIEQLRKVVDLAPKNVVALNNLAWMSATHQDDSVRDGTEALRLATKLHQQTGGKNPIFLSTLAAALAEVERFDDAIRATQRAIELADEVKQRDLINQVNAQLKLYEQQQPYRE